jgi:phosphoserine phosphatase
MTLISDSYDCITNHIVNKFGMDFSIANESEFSNSVTTKEVKIQSVIIKTRESYCNHDFCKSNAMREIASRYKMEVKNIIAIGDIESDICMIKDSGIGISFCSSNETLNSVASKIISERNFTSLVDFIQ